MDISSIMARAQRLMLDENFNDKVEQIASRNFGTKYEKRNNKIDTQGVEIIKEPSRATMTQSSKKSSKLPTTLLESFMETPPMSGDEYYNSQQTSALDSLMLGEAYGQQAQEQSYAPQPQPQQTYQPQSAGIDYGIIKYLINEAIKENMKTMLNESNSTVLRGMRIVDGNVFQYIDNKGNLWEGVMKLKKRATKK